MRNWRAAVESEIKEKTPLLSTIFDPGVVEVWADADQEGLIWPARPTSQARTGTRGSERGCVLKKQQIRKNCSHAIKDDEVAESVATQKRNGAVQRQGDMRSI